MNLKKTFRTVFYYFSAIKNIVAPLSSSNFPIKLSCWGILPFVCQDKIYQEVYNIFDGTNNLVSFLLYIHHISTFCHVISQVLIDFLISASGM